MRSPNSGVLLQRSQKKLANLFRLLPFPYPRHTSPQVKVLHPYARERILRQQRCSGAHPPTGFLAALLLPLSRSSGAEIRRLVASLMLERTASGRSTHFQSHHLPSTHLFISCSKISHQLILLCSEFLPGCHCHWELGGSLGHPPPPALAVPPRPACSCRPVLLLSRSLRSINWY